MVLWQFANFLWAGYCSLDHDPAHHFLAGWSVEGMCFYGLWNSASQ